MTPCVALVFTLFKNIFTPISIKNLTLDMKAALCVIHHEEQQ
jgi:hypothetical protein